MCECVSVYDYLECVFCITPLLVRISTVACMHTHVHVLLLVWSFTLSKLNSRTYTQSHRCFEWESTSVHVCVLCMRVAVTIFSHKESLGMKSIDKHHISLYVHVAARLSKWGFTQWHWLGRLKHLHVHIGRHCLWQRESTSASVSVCIVYSVCVHVWDEGGGWDVKI